MIVVMTEKMIEEIDLLKEMKDNQEIDPLKEMTEKKETDLKEEEEKDLKILIDEF